jgi:hypothetical protein
MVRSPRGRWARSSVRHSFPLNVRDFLILAKAPSTATRRPRRTLRSSPGVVDVLPVPLRPEPLGGRRALDGQVGAAAPVAAWASSTRRRTSYSGCCPSSSTSSMRTASIVGGEEAVFQLLQEGSTHGQNLEVAHSRP